MAVFIELVSDAFAEGFQKKAKNARLSGGRAGASSVRRPLRGLEIKDDTYAILKVIKSDGTELPLFDAGDPQGESTSYANFILQQVQDSRMEKHQIIETFGEPYIFFFGERPRFIDCTAMLLNSLDFNWRNEFLENYDKYLRGTKLVEMGARMYLFYDDTVVEGYLVACQVQDTSMQPMLVQMQFKLFVTNYSNVSSVGDPRYPVHQAVLLAPPIDAYASADAFTLGTPVGPNNPSSNEAAQLADQGFGGGTTVLDLLRQGLVASSYPGQNVDGFLSNASMYFFGSPTPPEGWVRETPLRTNIYDNADEWTGPRVQPPHVPVEEEDVDDVVVAVIEEVGATGGQVDNPQATGGMGVSPNTGLIPFGLDPNTPFSSSSAPGTVT